MHSRGLGSRVDVANGPAVDNPVHIQILPGGSGGEEGVLVGADTRGGGVCGRLPRVETLAIVVELSRGGILVLWGA